ncbi:MAG: 3-hydroxyacyl-CoA dehydrogenase family protein [Actinomycetota bacterium]|nr:3-hydroxyacyl-CoA dehydrogenase family protein [Actinomycetota bacterium]
MTDQSPNLPERLGIIGTGTIACGLARLASAHGEIALFARSEASAERARNRLGEDCTAEVVTELEELSEATFIVEAVVESEEAKLSAYRAIEPLLGDDTILTSSTSSLSITALAASSLRPDRFAGFHVFNPVERMKLVELCYPPGASDETRLRVRAFCDALGKTGVEVPDTAGFVVNRLLFPYLFDAVRLMEETGLDPASVDTCMRFGAGHPLGPLALLDLVGIDVSIAIGESIGAEVPRRLYAMAEEGKLGRKVKSGFLEYGG